MVNKKGSFLYCLTNSSNAFTHDARPVAMKVRHVETADRPGCRSFCVKHFAAPVSYLPETQDVGDEYLLVSLDTKSLYRCWSSVGIWRSHLLPGSQTQGHTTYSTDLERALQTRQKETGKNINGEQIGAKSSFLCTHTVLYSSLWNTSTVVQFAERVLVDVDAHVNVFNKASLYGCIKTTLTAIYVPAHSIQHGAIKGCPSVPYSILAAFEVREVLCCFLAASAWT